MDAEQEQQYAMTTVLVKFLADNTSAIGASPVAATEAADIAPAYARLAKAVGAAPLSTTTNTQRATDARAALLAALPALLGPLCSVATKAGDAELLARATLSARQLRKLRPEELRDVSALLFDQADAHASDLTAYGLTAPVLAQLRALHTAFVPTVRSTASLIDQRGQGNQRADDLLHDLMQQVYELDKPMDVFRLLNPSLYAGYKRARRVGKASGGPGPANGPDQSR
jgi:hypothetical protein